MNESTGELKCNIIKPFLRWAGGKQWLTARLTKLIPNHDFTYYEPFLGGGSFFFIAQPKKSVIGDINKGIVETYKVVRDSPQELIDVLTNWKNNKKTYYELRDMKYQDLVWRAAQFIYLNKTCWNGLYRVNRKGKFNVPYGYHKRKVFNESHLLTASKALKKAKIIHGDFQKIVETATAGDFVYLDPPYTVLHAKNGFRQYNENLFSWEDQIRLANTARQLANRGCLVVISNADNNDVLNLYYDFFYQTITRHSVLAADPKWRRKTGEAIIVSSKQLLPLLD